MFELSSRDFMTFKRENLILTLVSHQATSKPPDNESYHLTVSELLITKIMIWSYAYEVVNQGHVDKTAQGFSQNGN